MSILVGYSNTFVIDRNSVNKPEQRQQVIINELKNTEINLDVHFKVLNCDLSHKALLLLSTIHSKEYIDFLSEAYDSFTKAKKHNPDLTLDHTVEQNGMIGLVPNTFLTSQPNDSLSAQLPEWKKISLFCTDKDTPIFEETYRNAWTSVTDTIQLSDLMQSTEYECVYRFIENEYKPIYVKKHEYKCIYCVNASPGHHAGYNFFGGYCFFNNAMIASVNFLCNNAESKVFILDLDYHAGDGTNNTVNFLQKNYKGRLMTSSVHMDPKYDYPHYRGFEFENTDVVKNITLPPQCDSETYFSKLNLALNEVRKFHPTHVVLAFGADTYYKDAETVAKCNLRLTDYTKIGSMIGEVCKELDSKLFITQEGGYCIDDVGYIVTNLLSGIVSKIN